ncbi:MAG: hypothetical protein AAFV43_16910 [Planctomycetota bacterium]
MDQPRTPVSLRSSFAMLASLMLLVGCGPSAPESVVSSGAAPTGTNPTIPVAAEAPSAPTTAQRFLRSLLRGDAATARGLLTAQAATHVDQNPSLLTAVSPADVLLEVTETRTVSPTEAIAQCLLAPKGVGSPEELLCLLRRDNGIWGVTGLAWEAAGAAEPRVLRFEPARSIGDATTEADYVRSSEASSAPERTASEPSSSGQIR